MRLLLLDYEGTMIDLRVSHFVLSVTSFVVVLVALVSLFLLLFVCVYVT